MNNISRRDFLKIGGVALLIPRVFASSLKSFEVNNNTAENLEEIINKVKEKYKDSDFEENLELSYELKPYKLKVLSAPLPYKEHMINATTYFKLNNEVGSLNIMANIFFDEINYQIKTYYSNPKIENLQTMDEEFYRFIKTNNNFYLHNKNGSKGNLNFETAADDVITVANNLLTDPKEKEKTFLWEEEFPLEVNRKYISEELEKITLEIPTLNSDIRDISYYALNFKGKLIPIMGDVLIEKVWKKIPIYSLVLHGEIVI